MGHCRPHSAAILQRVMECQCKNKDGGLQFSPIRREIKVTIATSLERLQNECQINHPSPTSEKFYLQDVIS